MLENLKNKSEEYRKKLALGISVSVFLVMFFSWAHFKGFLGYSSPVIVEKDQTSQTASVVSSSGVTAASPVSNTKSAVGSIWAQIHDQYNVLTDSISSVLVPFITGIDVYQKTGK